MSKNIKQISKTNQEQFFCPENNALKVKRECISELEHKNIASINPERVSKVLEDILSKVKFYR